MEKRDLWVGWAGQGGIDGAGLHAEQVRGGHLVPNTGVSQHSSVVFIGTLVLRHTLWASLLETNQGPANLHFGF